MKTGEMEYTNAGHNPPYILRHDGSLLKLDITGNTILGCFEDHQYNTKKVQIGPNDVLFLFTDGVTEAFDVKEHAYGDERLENLLLSVHELPVDKIVNKVVDDVNLFSKGVSQSDDITLLSMKYFG